MTAKEQETTPVPGVMATLAAGFDLTTKHIWLILLPTLLDALFWLGPRLSLRQLIESLVAFWQEQGVFAQTGLDPVLFLEMAPRFNLFTSLSVPFVGVPALLTGITPEEIPLSAQVMEIESGWRVVGLFILFSVIGLFLTAVYYGLIATVVRQYTVSVPPWSWSDLFKRMTRFFGQLLGFIFLFLVAAFLMYIPLFIISLIVALLSPGLAAGVLLIGPMLLMWVIIYFVFTPHGLILNGRSLWRAMLESMQLIQRNLFPAMGLLLGIIFIGRLLDSILLLADDGSWFLAVGILGHAFVSTALLAATFIFYRDRSAGLLAQLPPTSHFFRGKAP